MQQVALYMVASGHAVRKYTLSITLTRKMAKCVRNLRYAIRLR